MLTTLIAAAVLSQQAAKAPEVTMMPGSPAPVPNVEKWVRGNTPDLFEANKVYVVEFWATWCGPCKASMPHLTKLSQDYANKGVVILGISDEEVTKVTDFLNKDEWKEKAQYTLGTDPDRSVYKDYMTAAGQSGIPTAFIVKDKTVQWIGHPMSMDEPLAQVVAGKWDVAAAKTKFEAQAREARVMQERNKAFAKARKDKDWDALIKLYDQTIADMPADSTTGLRLQKFQLLVGAANKPAEGYVLGRELATQLKSNAEGLNQIAWFVLDDASVKTRDLAFAMDTAKAAVAASGEKNPAILDTLARAYWETGDKDQAVAIQKKAVELAGDTEADQLKETLKKYQDGTPPAPAKRA